MIAPNDLALDVWPSYCPQSLTFWTVNQPWRIQHSFFSGELLRVQNNEEALGQEIGDWAVIQALHSCRQVFPHLLVLSDSKNKQTKPSGLRDSACGPRVPPSMPRAASHRTQKTPSFLAGHQTEKMNSCFRRRHPAPRGASGTCHPWRQ